MDDARTCTRFERNHRSPWLISTIFSPDRNSYSTCPRTRQTTLANAIVAVEAIVMTRAHPTLFQRRAPHGSSALDPSKPFDAYQMRQASAGPGHPHPISPLKKSFGPVAVLLPPWFVRKTPANLLIRLHSAASLANEIPRSRTQSISSTRCYVGALTIQAAVDTPTTMQTSPCRQSSLHVMIASARALNAHNQARIRMPHVNLRCRPAH